MTQAKTQAAELRERMAFDQRATLDGSPPGDGYGNFDGDWQEQFRCAARILPLKGGESILAARLTGQQPVVISIRFSSASARVTPGWRARDVRAGTEYNITAIANFDEQRQYFDLLATRGQAVG